MKEPAQMSDWRIFRGTGVPHDWKLPVAPPWRTFDGEIPAKAEAAPELSWRSADIERARNYQVDPDTIDLINAAIYLRRPLLITGKPGVGKSTLALSMG